MISIGFMVATLIVCCYAAPQNYQTTPVPILKQINQQNDDGSYSYGFKAADGTFKIETKFPNGEVFGKYGYVGDDGKIRVVEYGASKRGFEPKGSDINVAPPTLTNDVEDINLGVDDGEYREDPSIYEKHFFTTQKVLHSKKIKEVHPAQRQVHFYQPGFYQVQQKFGAQPRVNTQLPNFQHQRNAQSRAFTQSPKYFLQSNVQHQPSRIIYNPAVFNGHPATNIDLNTGSFTVSYSS